MEILFYVGMIIFGFYCLVNEDIEKVKKDFGVKWFWDWWKLWIGFFGLENFGWGKFWKFWRCGVGVEVDGWMRDRSDRQDPGPRSRTRSRFRKFWSDPHTDPGKPYPQPYPGSDLNSQSCTDTGRTRPPPLTIPPLVPTPTPTLTKNSTGPSHGPWPPPALI